MNEETLAVDVIKEVGPGGNYLKHVHTKKHFMKEHLMSKLASKDSWSGWERAGSKDILQRARDRAEEIIETHRPTPLEPEVERELEQIVLQARKELMG